MAGTRSQIFIDVLHGIDAVMYGVAKYRIYASESARNKHIRAFTDGDDLADLSIALQSHASESGWNKRIRAVTDVDDLADLSIALQSQKQLYSQVLQEILREQSITAIQGEELIKIED